MIALARDRKGLAYIAFVTVCIVWGTTYLGIHVALETVPVLLVAGLRWMFAGVVMSALMLATGRGLPKPRLWGPLAPSLDSHVYPMCNT